MKKKKAQEREDGDEQTRTLNKSKSKKEAQEREVGFISRKLEQLIEIFEKNRFTPLTAFIFLVIVGVIRSVSESFLFEFERTFSIYLVAQHTAFNFPVLIMGSLVLSLAAEAPLRKVYNAILPGFAIVTLPPLIDLLLGQTGGERSNLYAYHAEGLNFVQKIGDLYPPNMLLTSDISTGLQIMVGSIMALSGLYVAVKVRIGESLHLYAERKFKSIAKKICSIFFGVFGIWVVVWFIVAIVPTVVSLMGQGLNSRIVVFDYFTFYLRDLSEYYLFIGEQGYQNAGHLAELMILQQRSLYLTTFFFAFSNVLMILSMWLKYPSLLKKIFSSLKITIVLPLTVSALLGNAVLHLTDPNFTQGWALDPTYPLHMPYLFSIGAVGFFLGTFGSFVLDYHKGDGILSEKASKNMSIVSLLAGGSLAFLMGPILISLIFVLSAVLVYIVFRIKEETWNLLNSGVFASSCIIVYFLGVYTPTIWKTKKYNPEGDGYDIVNITRRPELSFEIIQVGIIIVFLLFMGLLINYLLENEILSEWTASPNHILTVILLTVSLFPALIFNDLDHLIVFGTLGISSAILTDEEIPFVPLGIFSFILVYILISLWELLPSVI